MFFRLLFILTLLFSCSQRSAPSSESSALFSAVAIREVESISSDLNAIPKYKLTQEEFDLLSEEKILKDKNELDSLLK